MAARSTQPRILCLDGGGIRGLSEILILKELMLQVRIHNNLDYTPEPRQCFDFICGTSTGGLLAVLLGRLGKSLAECETLFREFGKTIFKGGSLVKASKMVVTGSRHDPEGLATVIRREAGAGQEDMFEPDKEASDRGHVPVAVVAVSKTGRYEQLFRTYGVRASATSCSIVDACLATSAATTFFPSITINGVEYVDGAFKYNNPSSVALSELESAEWLAPMQDAVRGVGCLVSVGTGRPTFKREKTWIPNGARSLRDAATLCKDIAMDCHSMHLEVQSRFNKAGTIDAYYRFDVDLGLESVGLNESDEDALQHISAVTEAYMKGHADEMKRCAQLIGPRNAIKIGSSVVRMNRPCGLECSRLPDSTDSFYGREKELVQIQHALSPSRTGQKIALLYGIGGSGKTQLALRHIYQERDCYSAIVWVDASTRDHAISSIEEAAETMSSSWPRDIPPLNSGRDIKSLLRVTSRLRSTRYTDWLLVIDSADSLEEGELAEYIPACRYGSILITSTRDVLWMGFNQDNRINVGGLDHANSYALLTGLAERAGMINEESAAVNDIIKELSGIPLALEQAGALIRYGEFTFASFLEKYRKEYRRLMTDHPGEWLWSSDQKSRAIVTVLDMAYSSLENINHAVLLIFIGVLGSWQIPMSFIERFQFFDPIPDEPRSTSDDLERLQIVHDPSFLRLALHRLARFCLIRLNVEGGHIVSFMIHRVLCQWSLEHVTAHNKQEYIMQAACGLSGEICKGGPGTFMLDEQSTLDAGDPVIERKYLAPFMHCLSMITGHVSRSDLDPYTGRFRAPYATVLHRAAWAHLAQGLAENAKDCFHSSIGFDTVMVSQAGLEWPEGEAALSLLCGFSRACQKSGDLSQAVEALESALPLSERLYGSESNITLSIVSRIKAASERQEIMQQHHKAAVVASAATCQDSNLPKGVQESSQMTSQQSSHETEGQQELDKEGQAETETDLIGASYEGDQSMVKLLLGLSNVEIDPKDSRNRTPLSWAAKQGHETVVQLLLEKGADVKSKDSRGWTPLIWAAYQGHETVVQLLLKKGADVESKDRRGWTPLIWAAYQGHETVVQLLLEKGADVESKNIKGCTPLICAIERGHETALQLLLKKGADIESKNIEGWTPLSWAAQQGHETVIPLLLEKGADVESKDDSGWTPLFWATCRGYEAVIQLLLKKGADIESKDNSGLTPLNWAARQRRKTVIQLLLENGADIESKDNEGRTPLFGATVYKVEANIQLLLENGADIEPKDNEGWTPLFWATQRGHEAIIQLLLENGAKVESGEMSRQAFRRWRIAMVKKFRKG
ncbi:hypothetical protein QBC43DRAFT_243126 [Cladorrhinum sp. PSN259]|nr:hypothetical protein QBC43DRAFT_243126 [Cladorrhinum sp. PSN259]